MFSSNVVFEEFFVQYESSSFALDESLFDSWWVARGKMRVLKGFSRLEVCLIQEIAFVHNCFQKCSLGTCPEISAVNLIVG